MDTFVANFLGEQRNRCVGSIMGYLEREVYPQLNPDERAALRGKVLQSIGVYHDACRDMLKATVNTQPDQKVIVNEYALRLLEELHERVT